MVKDPEPGSQFKDSCPDGVLAVAKLQTRVFVTHLVVSSRVGISIWNHVDQNQECFSIFLFSLALSSNKLQVPYTGFPTIASFPLAHVLHVQTPISILYLVQPEHPHLTL